MHLSGLMVLAVIFIEFLRHSLETFYEILLFLCFVTENTFSQMYLQVKTMTGMRHDCELRGISFWSDRALKVMTKRDIDCWVACLIAALYIPFVNLQRKYLCQLSLPSWNNLFIYWGKQETLLPCWGKPGLFLCCLLTEILLQEGGWGLLWIASKRAYGEGA